MTQFGLDEKYLDFILEILNKNINAKFYISGSRAKNTYKEYSDIDIAIDASGERLSDKVLSKIISDFENSTLPYEVDVIDLNAISAEFKNIIKNSLIQI